MNDTQLHQKLPIGANEKILAVFRHHWFAYATIYAFTVVTIVLILGISMVLASSSQGTDQIPSSVPSVIIAVGLCVSMLVLLFAAIPLYLLKGEALVLTEEALVQLKKPSLLANQISQVNLAHLNDVTASQDALGTIFGYGQIKVETPGEQDDYKFTIVPHPQQMAKQIIEAHENYAAALESGRIKSTLGERQPAAGSAWRPANDILQTNQEPAQPSQYDNPTQPPQ